MVSTDSEEIAEIAREFGESVPFMRNSQNLGDYAACIYPTTLFIVVEKLKDAYRKPIT